MIILFHKKTTKKRLAFENGNSKEKDTGVKYENPALSLSEKSCTTVNNVIVRGG